MNFIKMKFHSPWNYSQPNFYKFSEDSILLAKMASYFLNSNSSKKENLKVLDACCGCGVVGFEVLNNLEKLHLYKKIQLTGIDIQVDFAKHFWENFHLMISNSYGVPFFTSRFLNTNLLSFAASEEDIYDVILLNPPYFQGDKSQDNKKAICRSIELNDLLSIIKKLQKMLSMDGQFFIVFKNAEFLRDKLKEMNIEVKILENSLFKIGSARVLHLNKN